MVRTIGKLSVLCLMRNVRPRQPSIQQEFACCPPKLTPHLITEAIARMIIDHADGLHECVTNGRADESETARFQILAQRIRLRRARRNLARGRPLISLRTSAHELPHVTVKRPELALHLKKRRGIRNGRCNLQTVAHDPRIRVAAFNHASTYVADVVWHGQSTRHIREGIESKIDLDRLRQLWSGVSPMSYFKQFARWPKKSLVIYANYDLTFLPEFSRDAVNEFRKHGLDHKVVVLPCGHYTTGETPFKFMDGWQIASFLRSAFDSI